MKYQIGTMIEIPRAALTAGEIAKEAEFFSFGTNDLTQMTFGFSRDDAAKFLDCLLRQQDLRVRSVRSTWTRSALASWSRWLLMTAARPVPNLGLGICGEHGGDPDQRRVLPQRWPGLRLLLSLPCAYRSSGCCSGCYQESSQVITLDSWSSRSA